MKDLLPGIVPLIPLDIWDIVINYLYATNIEPHKVFADSTKRVWMPLSSLKGDGPGQDVQGLKGLVAQLELKAFKVIKEI